MGRGAAGYRTRTCSNAISVGLPRRNVGPFGSVRGNDAHAEPAVPSANVRTDIRTLGGGIRRAVRRGSSAVVPAGLPLEDAREVAELVRELTHEIVE